MCKEIIKKIKCKINNVSVNLHDNLEIMYFTQRYMDWYEWVFGFSGLKSGTLSIIQALMPGLTRENTYSTIKPETSILSFPKSESYLYPCL